jgi:Zinc dependent phospholipase C
MLRRCSAAAVIVVLLSPASASAWGFEAHKAIMRRAIDILPAELKPYFVAHRDELVYRSIDPDLWRSVGWEEDSNHFMNFGAPEFGAFPFAGMPREYGEALQKFGEVQVKRLGTLPWREAEMFGNLQRGFVQMGRNGVFSTVDVVLFCGAASHYIQDATQPLHASNSYDGQDTNQRGIHSRFETELFDRFESRLTLKPAPPKAFVSPRDYAFDTLLESYQKIPILLKADKDAVGSKDVYDAEYYEAFFQKAKPLLEERLSAAITATASVIVSAWEHAGRPVVKDPTRTHDRVEKVR